MQSVFDLLLTFPFAASRHEIFDIVFPTAFAAGRVILCLAYCVVTTRSQLARVGARTLEAYLIPGAFCVPLTIAWG